VRCVERLISSRHCSQSDHHHHQQQQQQQQLVAGARLPGVLLSPVLAGSIDTPGSHCPADVVLTAEHRLSELIAQLTVNSQST